MVADAHLIGSRWAGTGQIGLVFECIVCITSMDIAYVMLSELVLWMSLPRGSGQIVVLKGVGVAGLQQFWICSASNSTYSQFCLILIKSVVPSWLCLPCS